MMKMFLKLHGMTQQDAAEKLKVSRTHLAQIMSGTKRPSLDLALRIAAMTDGAVPVESWARETASVPDASEDAA